MGTPLADHHPLDGCAAYRAGQPGTAVGAKMILKVAAAVHPIDGRAVALNTGLQHAADGRQQIARLRYAQVGGILQRVQARQVQGLIGVDIAQPGQKALVHQQGFELAAARAEHGVEGLRGQLRVEWLRPQAAQHAAWVFRQPDAPELARIVENQALAILEIKGQPVVNRRCSAVRGQNPLIAAHSQVIEQRFGFEVKPDEFCAPFDRRDAFAR